MTVVGPVAAEAGAAGRDTRPYRILALGAGAVITAATVALALAVVGFDPGEGDLRKLAAFMLTSGLLSLALGWLALRRNERSPGGSLRRMLGAISAFGLLVALANVAFTSWLMFLSWHDLWLLALLLGFALIPGYAVASLLSSHLSRTIEGLGAAARRMAGGDLATRVPTAGSDELRALAAALNTMAAQLGAAAAERAELERARRELIAAVSHDLRTPLASLKALTEALADGVVADPAGVRRYLGLMGGEVDRLNGLIDDLFELSQLESGALRLDLAPSPVGDLVSEALERMGTQAERRRLRLGGEVLGDPPPVLVDGPRVTRVLLNLVQNAIRHTPADGSVTVRAVLQGAVVRLEVRDTGEGIPAEELPRVFERFYRGDPARSREAGGGLGLAIARGIVEAHGGRIWAESAPGRGSCFAFTLPAAPPRPSLTPVLAG